MYQIWMDYAIIGFYTQWKGVVCMGKPKVKKSTHKCCDGGLFVTYTQKLRIDDTWHS